jgi:predicted transcriptional regulator of viral defense system
VRNRICCSSLAVLEFLQSHSTRQVSYDQIAACTGFERRTIILAVSRLERQGRLSIEVRGCGRVPNRYSVSA